MENEYALITGTSSGLGKAFAHECARMGYNLILADKNVLLTELISTQLREKYAIEVVVFGTDLTDEAELTRLIQCIATGFPISVIINNAGIGGTSSITETSVDRLNKMIMLNIRSMVLITKMLIPVLLLRRRAYILNVASMAAFTPIAYKNIYPASKAFVSSFSLGLKEELSETNISVSVLCPGSMMTNYDVSRRIIGLGSKGRMGLVASDQIAATALRKMFRRKAVIIPGIINRINYRLIKILPVEFRLRIISKEVKKEIAIASAF